MLKLIPNREITEEFYLDLINKRLNQIGKPNIRLRWIEADVKNAFVVGLKLLNFTNQTMFIGRSLRTTLTQEEFDAVVCHELSHVANGHTSKRLINFLKNFVSIIMGSIFFVLLIFLLSFLIWGEESVFHSRTMAVLSVLSVFIWFIFNYALLFDAIRAHEYEADGFAVLKLGVKFEHWKSALLKLSNNEDVPDYLRLKNTSKDKQSIPKKIGSYFSTHPKIDERISFLEKKLDQNLAFNFYVSSAQKLSQLFGRIFNFKRVLAFSLGLILILGWVTLTVKNGLELINRVSNLTSDQILKSSEIKDSLLESPTLFGPKLSYYIVKKNDPALIEYLINNSVRPGKILFYLSEFKNDELFAMYFNKYSNQLNEEEYFLILRKSAQMNFVSGYRLLVNSHQFDKLDKDYKSNVSRILEMKRIPASEK